MTRGTLQAALAGQVAGPGLLTAQREVGILAGVIQTFNDNLTAARQTLNDLVAGTPIDAPTALQQALLDLAHAAGDDAANVEVSELADIVSVFVQQLTLAEQTLATLAAHVTP